jgi:hypothetical protein
MTSIKMFINGYSMAAKNIVITEYKNDFIRDLSYFEVRVTNTGFDSKYKSDDLDKELEHKFMSGEIVAFDYTDRGRHYIFKCVFINFKKLKKGGLSFTAMVSGIMTITKI